VIERAVVLSSSNTIQTTDLPPHVLGESFYIVEEFGDAALSRYPYQEAKERAIASFNYSYITNLLRQTNGNLSLAAEKAGMDRSNFRKVLKKYGIKADDFRMRTHAGR
jgi:DNA-binding NtrC family response regulator